VLPGVVGSLQANEVIKLITGIGEPLIGRLLIFDALGGRFREVRLKKSPTCPRCSDGAAGRGLIEYEEHCGPDAEGPAEGSEEEREMTELGKTDDGEIPLEIGVEELHRWLEEGREVELIDVREPQEHRICRLDGARLLPLREIPHRVGELDAGKLTVVYCHHGPRSGQAVRFLRQRGFAKTTNLWGGIDAWSLRIDPSVPRY
jgi:adenylyltransferase/sulfurtransferase